MTPCATLALTRSPAAVAHARGFVRAQLLDLDLADLVYDAEVAISELVTNAIVHTRGAVLVQLRPVVDGVRVEVHDELPLLPTPSLLDREAMSGRGLLMVAQLATEWGSELHDAGKLVWFAMSKRRAGSTAELTVDELLSMWDFEDDFSSAHNDELSSAHDGAPGPCAAATTERLVRLPDLATQMLVDVKIRTEDLGREMALMVAMPEGHSPAVLQLATRLDGLIHELAPLRTAIRTQALEAAARGDGTVTVELCVAVADAGRIEDYADALDAADALTRSGELLSTACSAEHQEFRGRYLRDLASRVRSGADPDPRPVAGA